MVLAPLDESLAPQQRAETTVALSALMMKIATHIICYTLVDYQEQLGDERLSIAHAFLQRVTTTHMCNHKLTAEGLVWEYKGETFRLHEEYKTMTLTRTVYEHLAMFYFLFERPKTDEERSIVWKCWQINSMKNLLDDDEELDDDGQRQELLAQIGQWRSEIFATPLGQQCRRRLDEWTSPDTHATNTCVEFVENGTGRYEARRVSYSQAWKYLFANDDMAVLYRHLSMHSHPAYGGLIQYQAQSEADQGFEGIPLYLSTCLLAYLCKLFLKLIPGGSNIVSREFSEHDRRLFQSMAQLPRE